MLEEDGTGEFGAGETVQGTSETLGELDWQILNSISDKTVRSGYYANHRDVHQDHYVIVGEDEEQVKRMKKRMEALDERTLDEDQTVDHLDYEQLNEDAESQNVKILRSGRRRPATEHNVPGDNEIIEAEDKAYIAEEVSV
jgi:UDP-N-acetylmuramate-alanine ligase